MYSYHMSWGCDRAVDNGPDASGGFLPPFFARGDPCLSGGKVLTLEGFELT